MKDVREMKYKIGNDAYDAMNIVTGTLLHQAVVLMNKLGLIEEFLEDKNEISRVLIESILKHEKELTE